MKARVILLADVRNWAFDFAARSIKSRLSGKYAIQVAYLHDRPNLDPGSFDLLYIFWWVDRYHHRFGVPKSKVIREVASFRWQTDEEFGRLRPEQFSEQYLDDCLFVTTPARSLRKVLAQVKNEVFVCPNGFEPALFRPGPARTGPLKIGWVGNPNDATKGLKDILIPSIQETWALQATTGRWSRSRVARLYQTVDVIAIASLAESQPLPLIEGMASGCFPVTCNVGIVPEVVLSGVNGLVVERSIEGFRSAFEWCSSRLERIREAGLRNSAYMLQSRSWDNCAHRFDEIFEHALSLQRAGQGGARVTKPNEDVREPVVQWRHLLEAGHCEEHNTGRAPRRRKWAILLQDFAVRVAGPFWAINLRDRAKALTKRALPRPLLKKLKRVMGSRRRPAAD
jgi:glycosyltransferase involved in cell wall biosynthesis